jgi:FSR family fosmidomycin resistance protein-like MFS transporter
LLGLPGLLGSALDPLVGTLGDTRWRRAVLLCGGVALTVAFVLTSSAFGFWMLLAALLLGNPASGAFVSLAQASLVDLDAEASEQSLARWTLVGSVGYVAGPGLVVAAVWLGVGWRGALAALAVAAGVVVFTVRAAPVPAADPRTIAAAVGGVGRALRSREVLRWLATLEAADLLLDVFHGFLALYFVDVAGTSPATAAAAVAIWTGAGLIGDAALLVVLRRLDGIAFLRATAVLTAAAYPAFLLCPGVGSKLALVALLGLLNAGWYAIPKARLYDALAGSSGTAVAVGGLGGLAGSAIPVALGAAAGALGLQATLWVLLIAPAVLLLLLPRRSKWFERRVLPPADRGNFSMPWQASSACAPIRRARR